MKRFVCCLVLFCLLCGCSDTQSQLDRAISLRNALQSGKGCSFDCTITADYGKELYTFGTACQADQNGNLTFTVTQPDSISGITGKIVAGEGALTFDDKVLGFPLLADGELSPVSAPWLLLKTLLAGYIRSACMEGELLHLTIDDSYEEDAMQLEIWLDSQNMPKQCGIVWQGRRILSLQIQNFVFL